MKIFFFLFFALAAHAFEVPTFTPNVVDQTGKLSSGEIARINQAIGEVQRQGTLVGVLMTPTLSGEAIEDVASQVFSTWKLGQKGKDNGVLILVAVNDHKMRIEVGYGLEGRITDVQSQDVIRNAMKPNFRAGNFGEGIYQAVKDIGTLARGEFPSYSKNQDWYLDPFSMRVIGWTVIFLLIPALIMGLAVIIAFLTGNKGYKIRRGAGQSFLPFFFGMTEFRQILVKGFLYVNPGLFITLFPIIFSDEPVIPIIMNGLGAICGIVSIWIAVKNALDIFSEAKANGWVLEQEQRKQMGDKWKSAMMNSSWRRSSTWSSSSDFGSSSSSSSDSGWSSSDSSSSSSSDGGSSGGGGSSGDW